MTEELQRIEAEAIAAIDAATGTKALDDLDNEYLGRKAGKLSGLQRSIGTLPNDQRPLFGQAVNEAAKRVQAALAARLAALEAAERAEREKAEAIDVTLPGRSRPQG